MRHHFQIATRSNSFLSIHSLFFCSFFKTGNLRFVQFLFNSIFLFLVNWHYFYFFFNFYFNFYFNSFFFYFFKNINFLFFFFCEKLNKKLYKFSKYKLNRFSLKFFYVKPFLRFKKLIFIFWKCLFLYKSSSLLNNTNVQQQSIIINSLLLFFSSMFFKKKFFKVTGFFKSINYHIFKYNKMKTFFLSLTS